MVRHGAADILVAEQMAKDGLTVLNSGFTHCIARIVNIHLVPAAGQSLN